MNPPSAIANRTLKLCNGAALLLCLLTYLLFEQVTHYREISGELLSNPAFDEGLKNWRSSKYVNRNQIGTIDLTNLNPNEVQSIWQLISTPHSRVMDITAVYSTRGVVQGLESWHNARLGVGGREPGGAWQWDFKGTVFASTGTTNLTNAHGIVIVPEGLEELRVEFELGGGTGEFRVHEIHAVAVTPLPHIAKLKGGLLVLWGCLGLIVIWMLVRAGHWFMILGGAVLIFLLLLIPHSQKEELLGWSNSWLPTLWDIDVDHLLLFFCFATYIVIHEQLSNKTTSKGWLVISLVSAAVSLEVLQYFTQDRTANLGDVLINILGSLIPMFAWLVIAQIRKSGLNIQSR